MNQHLVKPVTEYAGGRVKVYGDPTDLRLRETVLTLESGQVFVYSQNGTSTGLTVSGSSGKLWRAVVLHDRLSPRAIWRLHVPPVNFAPSCFEVLSKTVWTGGFKYIAVGRGDLGLALANIWFIGQVPPEILGRSEISHSAADWVEKKLKS